MSTPRTRARPSGVVNTFHQLGMTLGLGVLIAASAHAGHNLTSPAAVLTAHVNTALATGSVLLALCLVVTLALVVPAGLSARRGRRATTVPAAAAAAARDWPARDGEGVTPCRS
ncbi:MAG TPA: hypothetical protein VMV17_21080 [Streptosporangiaceae bacterium]|nr:hypothetical protein [Streptosporangiaceae bacterium]